MRITVDDDLKGSDLQVASVKSSKRFLAGRGGRIVVFGNLSPYAGRDG